MKRWIHSATVAESEKHKISVDGGHLVYLIINNKIILQHIEVDSDKRGSGVGTELLDKIKKISDDSGMPIKLFAMPIKDNEMSQEDLIDWYEDRGFEYKGEGMRNELIYLPRK